MKQLTKKELEDGIELIMLDMKDEFEDRGD